MNVNLLACFILSVCMVWEAAGAFHEELLHDLDHEVVYRVPRGAHGKKKDGECRYKKGPWGDCDQNSNMQRKTLTLKRGDAVCEQSKVITRKCKTACKYQKGDWSACDAASNTRTRTDTLKSRSDSSCQPTRTLSKKCKKVCKYNKQAMWSECDVGTNKKTKVLTLKSGNPQLCEANKKIIKPCHKGNGHGNHKGNKGRQIDDEGDYGDEDE
jgi:pleiotrophin